jgi:hypothetical protein
VNAVFADVERIVAGIAAQETAPARRVAADVTAEPPPPTSVDTAKPDPTTTGAEPHPDVMRDITAQLRELDGR